MNEPQRHDRLGDPDALALRAAADELSGVPLEDQLEACRAEGDELSQPEFAVLARRLTEQPRLLEQLRNVQAADRRIAAAFRAVEVPPELAERLRAALAVAAPPVVEAVSARPARPLRRRLRWAGALLATTAALLLGISWLLRSPATYSADSIADQAQRMLVDVESLDFQPGAPPRTALPPQLAQATIESWRAARFMERDATVVRLERNGIRATLIIAPLGSGPDITGRLPREIYTTGKLAIGVLPDRKHLYVLAVRGEVADYRRFLQQGAVAQDRPRIPASRAPVTLAMAFSGRAR